MADGRARGGEARTWRAPPWAAWFAWTWVVLVLAAAAAELLDLEGLRLALDLTRPLR